MLTKRYRFKKLNKRTKKAKARKSQRGGVGFRHEVGACPIGGRPPVVATSDCPGVGPGSADFANALYGINSTQTGGDINTMPDASDESAVAAPVAANTAPVAANTTGHESVEAAGPNTSVAANVADPAPAGTNVAGTNVAGTNVAAPDPDSPESAPNVAAPESVGESVVSSHNVAESVTADAKSVGNVTAGHNATSAATVAAGPNTAATTPQVTGISRDAIFREFEIIRKKIENLFNNNNNINKNKIYNNNNEMFVSIKDYINPQINILDASNNDTDNLDYRLNNEKTLATFYNILQVYIDMLDRLNSYTYPSTNQTGIDELFTMLNNNLNNNTNINEIVKKIKEIISKFKTDMNNTNTSPHEIIHIQGEYIRFLHSLHPYYQVIPDLYKAVHDNNSKNA